MYDDGNMDEKQYLTDNGHAIRFTVPGGVWAINGVRFYAIRVGPGEGLGGRMQLWICDENMQPIYETSVPYSRIDTHSEKWHFVGLDKPLFHPGDVWVILDTNSTKSQNIFIGVDTSVTESHSKQGLPERPLIDLASIYDWMIRLELTKLSDEQVEELKSG